MITALLKEIALQKNYLAGEVIETIYFGGGTPSLVEANLLNQLLTAVGKHYLLALSPEITLEANPDDISSSVLQDWQAIGINRLSIGVQSFFDEDLQWMNRAHTAEQAINNLRTARQYFDNITIDLIYGTPQLTDEKWKSNVDTATGLGIPHLSCYALTVEPKTPLDKMIRQHRSPDVDPEKQSRQFLLLMDWMEKAGYEHYEISNFAKPGWRSRHNSSYWSAGPGGLAKKYLGIGPSAHSFNGSSRQWNVANNQQYMEAIQADRIPFEAETLTRVQQLNEYIMTALRTKEGVRLNIAGDRLREKSKKFIDRGLVIMRDDAVVLTREGKLLADGIAAELFYNDLADPRNQDIQ